MRVFFLSVLIFCVIVTAVKAAIFDVENHGIYGGFWRDLYKFGPVVVDTVGGDLGIFLSDYLKTGFSFATVAGLLSDNKDDDVFSSVSGSNGTPDRYSLVLNALEPADFAYSTAAFKLEYIIYDGSSFGWSTTGNFGQGVFSQGKINNSSGLKSDEYQSFSHTYVSLGTAVIVKFTKNFRIENVSIFG